MQLIRDIHKIKNCSGEANVDYNRDKYACHITELVKDWRNCFSDGKVRVEKENAIAFPFGLVQV
jgi:hypothetical protein